MYRVPADMPLYDILNEFQKGSSHMAAVVKARAKGKETPQIIDEEKHEENKSIDGDSQLTTPLLQKQDDKSDNVVVDIDKPSRPSSVNKLTGLQRSDSRINGPSSSENIEEGEVIGIITLEDVFEELLQVNFFSEICPFSSLPPVFHFSPLKTYYNCFFDTGRNCG